MITLKETNTSLLLRYKNGENNLKDQILQNENNSNEHSNLMNKLTTFSNKNDELTKQNELLLKLQNDLYDINWNLLLLLSLLQLP